jgi:hypothetical protein
MPVPVVSGDVHIWVFGSVKKKMIYFTEG